MLVRLDYSNAEELFEFRQKASKESEYVNELSYKHAIDVLRLYNEKDKYAFGIIDKAVMLGHIFFTIKNDTCFLNLISVLKENEGKGLAYELFNRCFELSKIHKCKRIELIVHKNNTRARNFYNKLGFKYKKKYDKNNEVFEMWI